MGISRRDLLKSRNFYWLSTAAAADFKSLSTLPFLALEVDHATVQKDGKAVTTVRLKNPTDHIAFFIHIALLGGKNGEEALPVRWDDNYFSLVPAESREVVATYALEDLKSESPVIDVGGWNILSPFESAALRVLRPTVKLGELFEVSAKIRNTSLDGSIVQLMLDGQPASSKRIWARGEESREVDYQLSIDTPGTHYLHVGEQKATIEVTG